MMGHASHPTARIRRAGGAPAGERARPASGRGSGPHPRGIGRGTAHRRGHAPGRGRRAVPDARAADDPGPGGRRRGRRGRPWRRREAARPPRCRVPRDGRWWLRRASARPGGEPAHASGETRCRSCGRDGRNGTNRDGHPRSRRANRGRRRGGHRRSRRYRHAPRPGASRRRRDGRRRSGWPAEGVARARARRLDRHRLLPTRMAGGRACRARRAAGHAGARRRRRRLRPRRARVAQPRRSLGNVRHGVGGADRAFGRRSLRERHHRVSRDRNPPHAPPRRPAPAGDERARGGGRRPAEAGDRAAVRLRRSRGSARSDRVAGDDGQDRAAPPGPTSERDAPPW